MDDLKYASDEVSDMFCEPCNLHGIYAKADGLCIDCCEYMCKMCLVYHRRYMPEHTQQDSSNMPTDFCVEKCSIHPKHLIKFLCQNCEEFACRECKTENHKNCEGVRHISSLVSKDSNTEGIGDIKEYMNYLHIKLEESQRKVNINTENISLQEIEAKRTIYIHREKMKKVLQDMKQEVIDVYDQEIKDAEEILKELRHERKKSITCFNEKEKILEKNLKAAETNMEEKIKQTKEADMKKLSGIEQKHREIANDLERISQDIDNKHKSGERCNTYVAVKTSLKALENFEKELQQMNRDTCKFKIKTEAQSFTLDTVEKTKEFFSFNEIVKPTLIEKSVTLLPDLKIKPVFYTSLCLLNENQLLITDNKNSSIYIVEDLLENKILSALPLPSEPWGIAKVNEHQVVITFPELGVARFLTLSDTMTVTKTEDLKVGYECYGVTCGHKRLVVTYLDPARIKILDMSGNVLKCFDDSTLPISSPKHLAISPNKRFIYISDSDNNTIINMTLDGKVKAIYMDDQLVAPFQLAVDKEGLVYVSGRGFNNVHLLTADLIKKKLLVDDRHEVVKPVSIALCENVDRLYIGTFNTNVVKVFSLYQTIQ